MIFMSIISQLEQEADAANDKIMESDSPQYYGGYGDGIQYAIDLLRKAALSECERKIAEAEFANAQYMQDSFIRSQLGFPVFANRHILT